MASFSSPDFIIIGGGTSGLVVADRLSEDASVTVLVLEAGQDLSADARVNVPGLWTTLLGSEADWHFRSVAQPGLNGRELSEPQGKGLGGSSAINGQAFIAPARADIDAWAAMGNPGWDWASLVPWYRKAYTLIPPADAATREHLGIDWINDDFRGTQGPIQVSFPGVIENPLCKAWIDAFRGRDEITTGDPFSGDSIGGYSNAATVDPATKTRSYSGSTHGLTILQRPNVRVLTGTTARKIMFEQSASGVRATGVHASVNGRDETFSASREVIVAAGVFNTPKLLELSGIGQKKLLEKLDIPVVLDLAGVGENLQDHLMTGVSYEVADGVVTADPLMRQEPDALVMAQKMYAESKAGPLTIGGMQSHAFMPLKHFDAAHLLAKCQPEPGDEDFCSVVGSIVEKPDECSGAWFLFLAQANLHEGGKSFVGSQLLPQNFASLGCSQSHPFSRGSTHITSADVDAPPQIDPRFFSHPADLEIMARHVQALETLRHSKALEPFFKPNGQRNHADAFNIGSLEGAKKYVLDTATTTYHTCGTAPMLPKDKGGVVDTRLIVYGTDNLRIVDASMFPLIPRGNIMSSVYGVAERAADIIKGSK